MLLHKRQYRLLLLPLLLPPLEASPLLSYNDPTVLSNSVSRLPVQHVVPLLHACVNKLQIKPSRGTQLIPWIRCVLVHHAGYLLSLPDLVDKLGGLYTLLDSRVAVYKKLLKLSGRLDLLLSQIGDPATNSNSKSFTRALKRARLVVAQSDLEAGHLHAGAGARDHVEDVDGDAEEEEEHDSGSEGSGGSSEESDSDDDEDDDDKEEEDDEEDENEESS
jgi:U3 small nucleolar RNA-associated protein 5